MWKRLLASVARIVSTVLAILLVFFVLCWSLMLRMPGRSHKGPLPAITPAQEATAARLRATVELLALRYPHRNLDNGDTLARAADALDAALRERGFTVTRQSYTIAVSRHDGAAADNLVVDIPGTDPASGIVVVGAHYDSCSFASRPGSSTPGADDNASGVAAALELATRLKDAQPRHPLRFVFYANEEPPYFQEPDMGSVRHAQEMAGNGETVAAMLSLECLGYYDDRPGSQSIPEPLHHFYPDKGDFILFVGNVESRKLVRRCVKSFRTAVAFPSQGAAPPGSFGGTDFSDHWSYWQQGWPALMVTDTAFLRSDHYHAESDLPDTLDYGRMARVVDGLEAVVRDLIDER